MPVPPTADPAFNPDTHEDPARRPGQPGDVREPDAPEPEIQEPPAKPGRFDERQNPIGRESTSAGDAASHDGDGSSRLRSPIDDATPGETF